MPEKFNHRFEQAKKIGHQTRQLKFQSLIVVTDFFVLVTTRFTTTKWHYFLSPLTIFCASQPHFDLGWPYIRSCVHHNVTTLVGKLFLKFIILFHVLWRVVLGGSFQMELFCKNWIVNYQFIFYVKNIASRMCPSVHGRNVRIETWCIHSCEWNAHK
jgi:hypothetical protein